MKDEKKTPEILRQPQDGETPVPDSELDKVSAGAISNAANTKCFLSRTSRL